MLNVVEPQTQKWTEQDAAEVAAEEIMTSASPGQLITHAQFDQLLHLPKLPALTTPMEVDRRKLWRLEAINRTQQILLKRHKRSLQNVHGQGYMILPPETQCGVAAGVFAGDYQRALRKFDEQVRHTDTSKFGDVEHKERNDLIAKIGSLRAAAKRDREELSPLTKPLPAPSAHFGGSWK